MAKLQFFILKSIKNVLFSCASRLQSIIFATKNKKSDIMELIYQRPELMKGKTILYVHGFASSGASGTVKNLRNMLPNTRVVAPDLPLNAHEAMDLLHNICETEKPDLIIGTSMGGMYAEQLYGFDRILVNPAFQIGETLKTLHGMGKQKWLNPREDGATEFFVTQDEADAFKDVASHCFENVDEDERRTRVYGLFGDKDPVVHTFDMFASHYINGIMFDGEHRLNDSVLINSVFPIINWIDDRQEGRSKPVLYIDMDGVLADFDNGWRKIKDEALLEQYKGRVYDIPGFFANLDPMPSAVKAFRYLSEHYDTYILTSPPFSNPTAWSDKLMWVQKHLGVGSFRRLIVSHLKELNYGDYLIDDRDVNGADKFMGTFIKFGEDPFKTWDDIIVFFERLGGQ